MSIDHHRNNRISPEYVLLGYLYRTPDHGYELHKKMVEEFGNIWHASQSQTYTILKRLAEKEFIQVTLIEQGKLPSKQLLSLSDSGRQRFESWLDTPTSSSVHAIRVEFITRLYFMQRYHPERVAKMIEVQSDAVIAGIDHLEQLKARLPTSHSFSLLAVELRIKLLHAVLEWLKDCNPPIDSQFLTDIDTIND